jgi:hypothetical protein
MATDSKEILGSLLPNIYVDKISLKEKEVEIDFHIKDVEDEEGKGTLSSLEFLKKFVLIKIEKVTNLLNFKTAEEKREINVGEEIKTFLLTTILASTKTTKQKDVINIHYSCGFKLETNYSNLNFILYSDFDYESLSKELKFSIDKKDFKIQKVYENVLQEGNVIKELERFVLPNKMEWFGNIIGNNNTGFYTDETPRRLLKKEKYKNKKVLDFRKQSTPTTTQPQPSPQQSSLGIIEEVFGNQNNNSRINNRQTLNLLNSFASNTEIIAEYYDIIDDNNYVSFVFSVNFENLIRQQNADLTQFINTNTINDILSKTTINNCILYRTKKVTKKTNNVNYLSSELKEIASTSFVEYSLLPSLVNKKMFLIKDESSNIIKSGEYEYSIELDITNGIIQYLTEKITTLITGQNKFNEYNALLNYPEFYDKKLNVFKPAMQLKYQELGIEENVINLATIFGELNSYTTEQISRNIDNFKMSSNPSTATIESIKYLLRFYEETLNNLFKYSGIRIENDGLLVLSNTAKSTIINIKKTFKNLINLNREHQVKLSFINIPDNNISYTNIRDSFDRLNKEYDLNDSQRQQEDLYSCLPPKAVIIEQQAPIIIENNDSNYLDSVFTQINLTLNKIPKFSINLQNFSGRENVINCLNFSKLIEQQGVVIEGQLQRPETRNNLNVTDMQHYSSNISLYNCITGLSKAFTYDANKVFEIQEVSQNVENFSSTIPIITQIGRIEQSSSSDMNNILFTSGKYILLYRIIYDLEFLDIVEGQIVWKKLTKNIFETKLTNRSVLFRLKQNQNSIIYDTSNMKTVTNFIVNFR